MKQGYVSPVHACVDCELALYICELSCGAGPMPLRDVLWIPQFMSVLQRHGGQEGSKCRVSIRKGKFRLPRFTLSLPPAYCESHSTLQAAPLRRRLSGRQER